MSCFKRKEFTTSSATVPVHFTDCFDRPLMREYSLSEALLRSLGSYKLLPADYRSCPYRQDYSDIHLLIQIVEGAADSPLFWAFVRDYGFKHMKPLGFGVFEAEPVPDGAGEDALFESALATLRLCMMGQAPEPLDNFDLDAELYSYYHVVPDNFDLDVYLNGAERLSVDEAAARLGCAPSNVKKLADTRDLDAYRHAGRVWIMAESVERFDQAGRRFRAGRRNDAGEESIREAFRDYLIDQGYSELTPSGRPSTVYDYLKRMDAISEHEGASLQAIASNPHAYLRKYEIGGAEEAFGSKSHNAVRAATRCFASCFGR